MSFTLIEKREIQDYRLKLNALIIKDGCFKKEISKDEVMEFKYLLNCFIKRFDLVSSLENEIIKFLNKKEFIIIEASSVLALLANIEKPVRFSAN